MLDFASSGESGVQILESHPDSVVPWTVCPRIWEVDGHSALAALIDILVSLQLVRTVLVKSRKTVVGAS